MDEFEDLDDEHEKACKELLRPVRKYLQKLKKVDLLVGFFYWHI
jgi:hypothetical protein